MTEKEDGASKRDRLTIFELAGEYGMYQCVYSFFICLVFVLSCVDPPVATFVFHDIPHRCVVTNVSSPASSSTSPVALNASSYSSNVEVQIYNDSCENGNDLSHCEAMGGQMEYECCYPFHDSAVSDFNLICENLHYKSIAESMLGLGYLVASLVIGQLSDKVGRRKVAVYLLFCKAVLNMLEAFCTNYYQFLILFFLNCFSGYGIFLSLFVLLTESFGSGKRYLASFKVEMANVTGELLACWMFYIATSWRQVPMVFSASTFVGYLIVLIFIYESPLWLLSQGRLQSAEVVIRRMSIMNRRPIAPSKLMELKEQYGRGSNETHKKTDELLKDGSNSEDADIATMVESSTTALDLFRHPVVRAKSLITMFNWFAVTSAFYVVYLNMTSLHGSDPFVTFAWGAVAGFPSVFVFIVSMQVFGRRKVFCSFMAFGAICGFCIMVTTTEQFKVKFSDHVADLMVVWLTLAGKFFFGGAFGVVYIWSSELFPTPVRNSGMGLSSLCGRIGLLLVPFALEYGIIAEACVAMLGFVSAFLSLFLPETLGTSLPQTLEESQNIHLRSISKICSRTVSRKYKEINLKSTQGSEKGRDTVRLESPDDDNDGGDQTARLLDSDIEDIELENLNGFVVNGVGSKDLNSVMIEEQRLLSDDGGDDHYDEPFAGEGVVYTSFKD